jgi:Domain of unknown function (DUF5615)
LKLLLDVHLSGQRIGRPLSEGNHDVVATEEDEELRKLDDELLLEWAQGEQRILVTKNGEISPPYARNGTRLDSRTPAAYSCQIA